VHFSSSDSGATLPADGTLTNGVGTFSNVVLKAPGTQTLTVADKIATTITGSATLNVAATTVKTFAITVPASATAGHSFVFTVTAKDASNNTITTYSGTVHFNSSDVQADLPTDATLTGGVGFFATVLRTAGPQTVTATDVASNAISGISTAITVNGLAPNHLAISAVANEVTGVPFSVTVKAQDQFGNTFAGYSGTVKLTSSDGAAALPGNSTLTNGVGTFNVTLKTPGTQTISGADTTNANIFGTSNNLATLGLVVNSLTVTSTGFVATFNKPFDPNVVNLYDTSGAFGPDDVILTGPASSQTSFHGSLIIDPTDTTITFVKTSTFTNNANNFNPQTGVLAAGTYTVTFRSAANGFKDLLGAPLDGTASGNPAGSNYTTTFVVATTPTQVVGIPGFARGPDSAHAINLPNTAAFGIPINLADGTGVTAGKFTLQYNSALLTITGATVNSTLTGATLTLNAASTPGTAVIDFSSTSALAAGVVRLGGLVATVPNAAASLYRGKSLLHFSSVSLNGTSTGPVGDDAVEVVGYFGDATGDGVLSGGDASLISRVATGVDNNPATGVIGGFAAYQLADPVLIGDLAAAGNVGAGSVTLMNSFLSGTPRPQIPAIPSGLTIAVVGPDPDLSLPTNLQATPGSTVVVPVQIDTAKPEGSTGMTEAILAVRYDPTVFTVSALDVELGTLPLSGSGWRLQTAINTQTGEIGIDLFSNTPIATTAGGSLVTIALHVRPDAASGSTGLMLVNAVNPTGQRAYQTTVSDVQGPFILHPAETALGTMPGTPGSVTVAADSSSFAVGQFMTRSEIFEPLAATGRLDSTAVSATSSASALPLSLMEQVFGGLAPLSLAQQNTLGEPGAILNSSGGEQAETIGKEQSLLATCIAQQDWVSDEMVASLGQSTKAGNRSPFGEDDIVGQEGDDLGGVEAFFAREAVLRGS
jgi:hypothetical protein